MTSRIVFLDTETTRLPYYCSGTSGNYVRPADDITPRGQLRKRRSDDDLERLLAERMAQREQQRGEAAG